MSRYSSSLTFLEETHVLKPEFVMYLHILRVIYLSRVRYLESANACIVLSDICVLDKLSLSIWLTILLPKRLFRALLLIEWHSDRLRDVRLKQSSLLAKLTMGDSKISVISRLISLRFYRLKFMMTWLSSQVVSSLLEL